MAMLKMVAGKTYAVPGIFGNRMIQRGEVVEVTDEQAKILLEDKYTDALNNEHPYFLEQDEPAAPKTRARRAAAADKE